MSCRPRGGCRRFHHPHQHHHQRPNGRACPLTVDRGGSIHRYHHYHHQHHNQDHHRYQYCRYHPNHNDGRGPISVRAIVARAYQNQCPARAGISWTGRTRTPNLPARNVAMMSGYRVGRDLYSLRRFVSNDGSRDEGVVVVAACGVAPRVSSVLRCLSVRFSTRFFFRFVGDWCLDALRTSGTNPIIDKTAYNICTRTKSTPFTTLGPKHMVYICLNMYASR